MMKKMIKRYDFAQVSAEQKPYKKRKKRKKETREKLLMGKC